jgi:hypothetical protein
VHPVCVFWFYFQGSNFKVTSDEKIDFGFWVLGGKHSDAWKKFIEIYLAHLVIKIFLPEITSHALEQQTLCAL